MSGEIGSDKRDIEIKNRDKRPRDFEGSEERQ
jgi:hypothetical protein